MSAIDRELFYRYSTLPFEFRGQLDRLVEALYAKTSEYDQIIREFVDATSGAKLRYLPNGGTVGKVYAFVKTDSSANTVTIIPLTGQTINGSSSLVLSNRGDGVFLVYDRATLAWWGAVINATGLVATSSVSSSTTLTAANRFVVFTGSTVGQTLTLPSPSPAGRQFTIKNRATVPVTVASATGTQIFTTAAVANIVLAVGDGVDMISDGTYFDIV